jgi:hypothetical protein
MLKSKKAKVAAGVVVVGMVASMGTAFAATDAGAQLSNWYNAASTNVKNAITTAFNGEKAEQTTAHAANVNGIIGQARNDIRDAGIAERNSVKNDINSAANEHASDISDSQAAILGSISGEYDGFVSGINAGVNSEVDGIGAQNETAIKNAVRNHTGVYVNRVNEGAAEAQSAAISQLTTAINDAKTALNNALASEQTTATNELIANLEAQLEALIAELEALTASQVAGAKTAIEAAGDAALASSLSALDTFINAQLAVQN